MFVLVHHVISLSASPPQRIYVAWPKTENGTDGLSFVLLPTIETIVIVIDSWFYYRQLAIAAPRYKDSSICGYTPTTN